MTGILICIWRNMKGALTMTNAEKLNNMTNAELLFYIYTNNKCDSCIYEKEMIDNTCFNSIHCPEGIKKWLESEIQ